jgi:RNA polymerase sigma-70 factor, ECF subfamily
VKAVVAERARATTFRATCEDERAFRSWYDAALPQVYGYLLARCAGSVALAEELTQEAFVDAVRNRHRFDGRSDAVTWVISIAKHKLADHYRRLARTERRRVRLVSAPPEPGEDAIAAAERREDVLRALRSLPPGQRAVLVYRYLDDLPVASIAARVGRSESATESLLSRGREALRRELGMPRGEATDG